MKRNFMRNVSVTIFCIITASGCASLFPARESGVLSLQSDRQQAPRALDESPLTFVFLDGLSAFPQLIAAERELIAAHDLAALGQLWADDGQIIDGRGTEFTEDDYIWRGREAILDRYLVAVFPNPPPLLEPPANLQIDCLLANEQPNANRDCLLRNGLIAEETIARVQRDGDRWEFVYRGGRWWMGKLAYSQP